MALLHSPPVHMSDHHRVPWQLRVNQSSRDNISMLINQSSGDNISMLINQSSGDNISMLINP